jgi:O-antigen/teichoic acid export membrane protein
MAQEMDYGDVGGQPGESEKERIDRELMELLTELRVAIPGVQVLFAFLLVVPFQQRFVTVTQFQKTVYFVGLLCAAAATTLLIAPSANHRILFRAREKPQLLKLANRLSIAGLGFLAAAVVSVVLLVADYLYGVETTVVVAGLTAAALVLFWYAVPLRRRMRGGVAPQDEL